MTQPALANTAVNGTASNDAQAPSMDATWTGFLQYKAPLEQPTLTLRYELDYSLSEVVDTFKSMVFEDMQNLPERFKKLSKFTRRKLTFEAKSSSSTDEFVGNDNQHSCEVLRFEVTLEPLIPGFDAKAYEQKLQQKNATQAAAAETQAKQHQKTSSWDAWTSMASWKEWGSSMVDMEAWGSSISSWMQYLHMNTDARELWKVDWIQHKAVAFVKNITFSWTIGVSEYSEIEQLMRISAVDEEKQNDSKVGVVFIKKLFVQPIVPMPAFLMDLLKEQYKKDSDLQISIVKMLCEHPLTSDDDDESLQQLQSV